MGAPVTVTVKFVGVTPEHKDWVAGKMELITGSANTLISAGSDEIGPQPLPEKVMVT